MFDIGWQELLVIAIVAIVVVGPKELPAMMRVAGQWMGRARRMARDFQLSLEEIGREAELEALRRDIDNMKRARRRKLHHRRTEGSPLVPKLNAAPRPIG